MDLVEQGLTLGGYGRGDGHPAETARTIYGQLWGKFDRWCRSHGRRPMPATSETLAKYCEWLMQEGYAVATAELACTAVRWRHRVAELAPPDRVAAWYVLRRFHASGRSGDTQPFRAACRDDVARVAESCDLGTAAGLRDLVAVILPWALGVGDGVLAALTVGDLTSDGPDRMRVTLPDAGPPVPSWRLQTLTCGGVHDPGTGRRGGAVAGCPTCVLHLWRSALASQGITGGPLIRPVDAYGKIAGTRKHAGSVSTNCGMRPEPIRHLIARVMGRADLDTLVCARPVTALRIGSALAARRAGAPPAEVAARAGYRPDSMRLARYLADAEATGVEHV